MECQQKLRSLVRVDEGFVQGEAVVALGPVSASTLDAKTAALLQLGALVTIGSAAAALRWGVSRALARGATEDEVADVLLAVAPVIGIGRVGNAASQIATALGLDIRAATEGPHNHLGLSGGSA